MDISPSGVMKAQPEQWATVKPITVAVAMAMINFFTGYRLSDL